MTLFKIHNPHALPLLKQEMNPHKTMKDPAGCRTIRWFTALIEDGLLLLL
jgi:hypothetical protein